jgi:hypothetical protein
MGSKRIIQLNGIILVLFGVFTIISMTGNSISVCDALQPNSISKERMNNRQLQLAAEDSSAIINGKNKISFCNRRTVIIYWNVNIIFKLSVWFDELTMNNDILASESIYARR